MALVACLFILVFFPGISSAEQRRPLLIGDSLSMLEEQNGVAPVTWPLALGLESIAIGSTGYADWAYGGALPAELIDRDVIVLLGSIDAVKGDDPDTFRSHVEALVGEIRDRGARSVALVGSPRVAFPFWVIAGVNQRLLAFHRIERDVCLDMVEIDCEADLDLWPVIDPVLHLRSDGVHLNEQGEIVVVATLMQYVPEPSGSMPIASGVLWLAAMARRRRGLRA